MRSITLETDMEDKPFARTTGAGYRDPYHLAEKSRFALTGSEEVLKKAGAEEPALAPRGVERQDRSDVEPPVRERRQPAGETPGV